MDSTPIIHSWAWIAWLVSALTVLSLSRNPLYLILVWLCITIVSLNLRRLPGNTGPMFSPLRFSFIVILLSSLINALLSRYGTTVLFHLPNWLPILGGIFTLEALIYGAINGMILAGIFASFTVVNQALPVQALIRLIPRAFYPVAVVTSIAITFIPTTLRQFTQIREAQAVRGHRLRGLRDWLPLFLPLLVGGLERALALSEAMTARGFSHDNSIPGSSAPHKIWPRLVLTVSLLCLFVGWLIRLQTRQSILSSILLLTGALSLVGLLVFLGRQSPRSIYTQETWKVLDTLVLFGAIIVAANFLLPLPGLAVSTRLFNPYPTLQLPSFEAIGGCAILGLLTPVIILLISDRRSLTSSKL